MASIKETRQTLEIAGAGLAGLMLACRMAQLGWRVCLHERNKDLRMFGAGIWIWESGLRALEMVGALDQAIGRAKSIKEWRVGDADGNIHMVRSTTPTDRLLLPPRADMYQALIDQAYALGVEIFTSSTAVSVRPEGVMVMESGEERHADLVVVADGAFSRLRECILATSWFDFGKDGGVRMLIPHQPHDPTDIVTEYWNGGHRLLYNPCTEGQNYVFLGAPLNDDRARAQPIDRPLWKEKFPGAADLIDRFVEDGRWDRIVNVRCRHWSEGKVAIIGDAAHGMPPNLGQAANTAFFNSMALAMMVTGATDIPATLRQWEAQQRPITDHVQWFSVAYGMVVTSWPRILMTMRDDFVSMVAKTRWFDEGLNRGARYVPAGYDEMKAAKARISVG